jgi:hypothetical protein
VEEKLFVNRYEDWSNVICCKKWTNQRYSSRCRCRAKVGRLANLASRLVLSLGVRVKRDLGEEQNKQSRQSEGQYLH